MSDIEETTETEERVHIKDLGCGELYETCEEMTWSDWDNDNKHLVIPAGETVMFRSFQPYPSKGDPASELSLFVWLKEKKTVCLLVSEKHCFIYLKHIPWETRHNTKTEEPAA